MAYAGRLAIIAGGLGGIGTAISQVLRSHGAKVALLYAPFEADRKDSILRDIYGAHYKDTTAKSPSSEFSDSSSMTSKTSKSSSMSSWQLPDDVSAYECDITDEASVNNVFDTLSLSLKKGNGNSTVIPSMLINSAGYVTVTPFEETSAEEATRNILPNLLGPFLCSKAFYHLYRAHVVQNKEPKIQSTPGRIVSISSQAAHVALEGHGPYCASKAGLLGLTRVMALEWGGRGISANTVSPTVVMTTLGKKAWADPIKKDSMLSQIPVGRFAEPSEVAEAVEFLCRDSSGMINGDDIRLDGGFTFR